MSGKKIKKDNASYNNTLYNGFYFVPNHTHKEVLLHFQLCKNATKRTSLDVLRADCIDSLLSFGFW